MINKITYADKVAIQNDTDVADINKVTDDDMNEIKRVVNNNADDFTTFKDKVDNNQITGTVEGDNIYINDAYSGGTAKMTLLGKSEQETRSGKNLLSDFIFTSEITTKGITFTPVFSSDNELLYINVNGTATEQVSQGIARFTPELNVEYKVNGCPTGGTTSTAYIYVTGSISNYGNNDTSAIWTTEGTKTLHIVVASGATISNMKFYPMVRLATFTDNSYEPYGAMPSPDYPSKIQNIEGDVEVGFVGKNEFNNDTDYYILVGASLSKIESGIRATTTNTGTFRSGYVLLDYQKMLGKTYTLSAIIKASASNNGRLMLYWYNDSTMVSYISEILDDTGSITFTMPNEVPETANQLRLVFYSNRNGTVNVGDYIDYTNVQLEKGDKATAYEPYQAQTANFTFTEGQKLMEGGYLASDGIHNEMKQEIFNGSENWSKAVDSQQTENTNLFYRTVSDKKAGAFNIKSNLFPTKSVVGSSNDFIGISGNDTLSLIYVRIDQQLTVEEFKTWLSTNNLIVEYELAEPVITPYTAEQQEQWDKLQSLQLFDGVNNISSPATMQLTYVKSTASVINNLQDQINELKQAIVSIGGV